MTPGLDWDRLRPGANVHKSFEDLCCRLAELESAPPGSRFLRLAAPDGGVECLRRLPDGSEWGWQAKYFRTAFRSSQWAQIDKSVRSALQSRTRLQRCVVCVPVDRTKNGAAAWDGLVEKWKAIKPISYEYWGGHELESMLTDGRKQGLLKYYFDKEFFSTEWAGQAVSRAIANAGPRYTPKQNIDLPVGKRFQALCGTQEFFDRLNSVAESIQDWLSNASTRPALDAAADEFAKLGALTSVIAGMLSDHDMHKSGGMPVEKIRTKSAEAKAVISCIASKLSDQNMKNRRANDAQHYTNSFLVMEQDRLEHIYDALGELTDGELSKDIEVYNTKALLITGEAGVGKTHLFCDVAKSRVDRKQMTTLLHGSHFRGGPPQATIIKELDLDCTFSEFLEGLDESGRPAGSRSLLMIDALNEGVGKDMWKTHMRGLLHEVGRFPYVALAISVRTPYVQAVVPDDIAPSALHRIEHRGFGSRTEDAFAMFFDNNGIRRPSVPVMMPEFSNPQFLTILRQGLLNKKYTSMPEEIGGIAGVYDLFIDSVSDKLSSSNELQIPREFNIAQRAVDAIAKRLADGNCESIEYTEAYRLLHSLDSDLPCLDRLLDALITEGVLGTYTTRPQKGASVKRVRFAYERMSDSLIIKSRLDEAVTVEKAIAMLEVGGSLAAYVDNPAHYRGLVDALSAQLPERFGKELLEMVVGGHRENLAAAFLDSLLWRTPRSIGNAAMRLVDELIEGRRLPDLVLKVLLTHSTSPGSPLNADYLHRHLAGLEMGDRDHYLAAFLHDDYTRDPHSIVARHIDWAMKEGQRFDDKIARLAGTTLGWFLTASNRPVRDLSTKALVSMFTGREGILVNVISKFKGCNDPYVLERLFCAAYGCAMRGGSGAGLERLAAHAYDAVFRSGSPPPDIMLRDYARGIILLAGQRGINLGIDPGECTPPHDSDWIGNFPTENDIERLRRDHQGHPRGGASSIFRSLGRMGDFYCYVIGEDGRGFPWTNARLAKGKATCTEPLGTSDKPTTSTQEELLRQLGPMLSERAGKGAAAAPQTGKAGGGPLKGPRRESRREASPGQAAAIDGGAASNPGYSPCQSSKPDYFDTAQFARWIARRVFELGWTVGRFDGHDAPLGSPLPPQDGAERIGKKYQWIAYHELLARLSDNFEFSEPFVGGDESAYETTSQLLAKRDIDPSLPQFSADIEAPRPAPCIGGRPVAVYSGWNMFPDDDADWLRNESDLPNFGELLAVSDGSGRKWIALDMFYSANRRPVRAPAARSRPRLSRYVEVWATSAIVSKKDGPALGQLAQKERLGSLRFPGPEEGHGPFLGELYWAHPFRAERQTAAPPDALVEPGGPGAPIGVHRTAYRYHAEMGGRDFSQRGSVSILAPSRFLAEGMNLTNMSDGTFNDAGGECVACSVDVGEEGAQALLFRLDPLARFLESNRYELFWRTAACKYIAGELGPPDNGTPSSIAINTVYRMRGACKPEIVRSEKNEE